MSGQSVTILGGGIAGLTAAWQLSHFDIEVHLIEKDYFLGGHAIQYNCKATEKCEQCDACTVEKMLKNVAESTKIQTHLAADVQEIKRNKNFELEFSQKPIFSGQTEQEALAQAFTQSPISDLILRGFSVWNQPLYALNQDKTSQLSNEEIKSVLKLDIDLKKSAQKKSLNSQAVILATGFQPFNPCLKSFYNYEHSENIVTALDLERSKKEKGLYLNPANSKIPYKTAFIQCVGSRNEEFGHLWCSQVCCPYALRIAQVMQSENPDMDITFYYMDIQSIGMDSPKFYEECQSKFRFIRNIPVDISPEHNGSVFIRYLDEQSSQVKKEDYDLVVLSIGITPGNDNERLARLCNVSINQDGFFQGQEEVNSSLSQQEGVFLAGTTTGPKSIAKSIAHTGQTVQEVIKYLGVE